MRKLLRFLTFGVAGAVALGLFTVALGLVVARASLPSSSCMISEAQVDRLRLEMHYDDVKAILGCDGVRSSTADYGSELRIEKRKWRGDAWPYAVFEGEFINGIIHGTSKTWLKFQVVPHDV